MDTAARKAHTTDTLIWFIITQPCISFLFQGQSLLLATENILYPWYHVHSERLILKYPRRIDTNPYSYHFWFYLGWRCCHKMGVVKVFCHLKFLLRQTHFNTLWIHPKQMTYLQHQWACQRYAHSHKFDSYSHNNDSHNQKDYDEKFIFDNIFTVCITYWSYIIYLR